VSFFCFPSCSLLRTSPSVDEITHARVWNHGKRNKDIFETIYFGACEASMELAQKFGPYETYEGSPASKGKLQFDLWGIEPSGRWDWCGLKAKIAKHGMRNSLLVAPMPTASTAQILGNNEGVEPFTSNIYNRR